MPTMPLREALRQAITELTAGRSAEAARRCDVVLSAHPRWLEAQRIKAEALIALGRFPDAEQLLDAVLAANPEHVGAYVDRAYLMERRGDALGALACFRRACELTADNAQLRAHHNQLAAQLGRPSFTPSHTGLARLYLRADQLPHAVREWDIALQANPNRLDAQIGIAETLWRMGDTKRSQDVCRYILRHMPFCLKPLLFAALFELDAGNQPEAQRLVRMASELDPEQTVAGELFADLVAAGRADVAQLFRDATRSISRPLEIPATHQTGAMAAARAHRPITNPLPTGQLPTGPLFGSALPPETGPTGKLDRRAAQPAPMMTIPGDQQSAENFFSQSRASMVPQEFQHIFRETEYMLWSRDGEDPPTAEMQAAKVADAPAVTPAAANPAPTASAAPETAPKPSDSDTEMGFVRWLQAQGARPLDQQDVPAPLPAAPSAAPSFANPAPRMEAPSASQPATPVIPPPPFLMDALQEARGNDVPPERAADAAPVTRAAPGTAELYGGDYAIPPADDAPAPPTASADVEPFTADEQGALTIEAIEQGLTSAGFARLETGRLASLASTLNTAPAAEDTPEMDVPQRLSAARELRTSGRMGEALNDYRALVKAAAEHMPEVVRDLRDAAIEDAQEPEIQRLLGDALIRQGDYVEALEAYNRANALRQEQG